MFRSLFLVAAMALFVIAALGAFGKLSGVNYSGYVAVGLACLAAGAFEFKTFASRRR